MLLEEEKKAIKYFYNLRSTIDESYMLFDEEINLKCGKEMIKQITIFLNLITKLQKENKEKDKQIDELVKYIDSNNYVDNEECQFQWDFKIEKCVGNGDCKDCIKRYFEQLVKEKGE